MDGKRFDDFARAVGTSRRGVLKILFSGVVAGLTTVVTGEAAEERRSRFYHAGQPCESNDQCGSLAPCQFGVCTPIACRIGTRTYQNAQPRPGNDCQFCAPTLENWTDWSNLSDGSACEPGQSCCNGDCCTDTQCCVAGVCEECGPHCTIEGVDYGDGVYLFAGACEWCNVGRDPRAWSIVDDGSSCGDEMDQVCCAGNCCINDHCCNEERQCTADCSCNIEGTPYENEEHKLGNFCLYCNAHADSTRWWPVRDRTACETPPGGLCCDGVCCNPGECCDGFGACTTVGCNLCRIEGIDYTEIDHKPGNDCQVCTPSRSTMDWTARPNNLSCTSVPGGFCCNGDCLPIEEFCDGVCLPPGECCNANGNRVDGECTSGCTIDGETFDENVGNPDNACEFCNLSQSNDAWSPRVNGLPCARDENRVCCNGTCCGVDECCDPETGACGTNGCASESCTIDGTVYSNFAPNPDNECEHCNAFENTSSWSPSGFNHCGPTGEQFCSGGGVCCDLAVCPDLVALVCGDYCDDLCAIGGIIYRHGDHNPANDCEACNNNLDPTAWSPVCSDECCAPMVCDHAGGSHCAPRD